MRRPDRKLAEKWNRKLSKYGLSEEQFRSSGLQQIARNASAEGMAFDPELEPRNTWKNPAQRRGYTMNDFGSINLVPVRYAPRQVPEWALDNRLCRALLESRYPRIHKPGSRDRRDGARAALILYYAYRLMWSDEQIGNELGIARMTVCSLLWLLKGHADKLFSDAWEIRGYSRSGHPIFDNKRAGQRQPGPSPALAATSGRGTLSVAGWL